MKNTILKIFNKRVLIFTLCFEIIVIVMTSMLGAQDISLQKNIISKNKINYGTALELHNRGKYLEAYNQFTNIMNTEDDMIIRDYTIYYGAKSALLTNMYNEAIDLYALLMKEYPRSSLYPYAEQYKALSEFYRDDYPISNFFNGKSQKWIKEFVGIRALRDTDDTNKARMIAYELLNRFGLSEAAIYYNNNFPEDISSFPNNLKFKTATILYEAGYRKASLKHFQYLYDNNAYKASSTYYMARIKQKSGDRRDAAALFDEYLSNLNNKSHRRLGLYYSADNYNRLKNYEKSIELYNTFLKEYPRDDYVPRIYNSFVTLSLNRNNLVQAKTYLTNVMKRFPKSRYTELALKSYLRKAFKLNNKTETYFATKALEARYTSFRHDFALSWNMWTAEEFGDIEKRDEYLMKTLLTSKSHYFIKGALSLANNEMIANVQLSNTYYLNEAKRYYADSNFTKSMQMLNKIQFLNYIATGKEDNITREARALAKNILMHNRFVKDLYANRSEDDLFNELSLQTRREVNKAIILYYYGDYDNAYTEFDKIFKKTQVTYPLFYFAEKIFKDSGNTKRLIQVSANIGKYFGYPYSDNVDLLPDEFRKRVYPRYFDEYVVPEAKYYKIEPAFVYAIMREESLFDPKAKSWVGAMGLMQLMPTTAAAENKKARYRYNPLDLTDPKQNINLGVSHLGWLFSSQKASNYILVAASYNAGSGRGRRWKAEYGTNNMYRTGRFIDIEETEYYVERVIKSYEYYSKYYKD
ncbi:lytic transglycosylase domain-containing protein [Brachyspira hyodysenteriae]|uniref:lytic transglycosylase domain-containing protein n=1 Tax=Brachyspira hyodysenteriae TaxID=159 RepID=UPI00063D92AF|nr:transglycosylase SLT domain-containing protein [Brachyspira hyodysenteriae]AUJ48807.1 lytic transglycosylase [Brachyspira hyodysenteriae]KLI48790.1 lytic transglycosylase [Brachyspira hyodysenteriae]MDA0053647.1 transglycosylase SLT domain-containing protein [Brachyspira hyodysenteriae]TVL67031.1 lytic transglycosylase [Brachyspira hyodysenteriae]TVL68758.1 lytic transglycosylase [Brachyspira hyodysenteriae]